MALLFKKTYSPLNTTETHPKHLNTTMKWLLCNTEFNMMQIPMLVVLLKKISMQISGRRKPLFFEVFGIHHSQYIILIYKTDI